MASPDPDDGAPMRAACELARRAQGRVAPNPPVGCVLVTDGRVVGRGHTAVGGRPHAEAVALAQAGRAAAGATAYVTLEPCCHAGRGPPCAQALAAAGVHRVVVATGDPDPRMAGAGLVALRHAGVTVRTGVAADAARRVAGGHILRQAYGRPRVTAKLATSLDGAIATATGASQWITGATARRWGHGLRARSDAVLVGSGTALADDPSLTCRLPGLAERSPVRVVLDGRLRLPQASKLVASAGDHPTWLVTTADQPEAALAPYRARGVEVLPVPSEAGGARPSLPAALRALGAAGITDLMVEGGATVMAGLARAGLLDHVAWLQAPIVIGGDGRPGVAGAGVAALTDAPAFVPMGDTWLDRDRLAHYDRAGLAEELAACSQG